MSELRIKIRSNYLDGTANVDVIMPNPFVGHDPERFYGSGKRYPVLWLLHSEEGRMDDWITYSSVPRLGIWRNTIIVAPEAPNSDFINHLNVGEGYRYQDFFFHELMPFVYNWLPASQKREDNFLAGSGMGSDAVWRCGLIHPERFGCIAPLGKVPPDFGFLEPFWDMEMAEFLKREEAARLGRRVVNNMREYATVGRFLDSTENTMLKVLKAGIEGLLPPVWFPYPHGKPDCEAFGVRLEGVCGNFRAQAIEAAGSAGFLEAAVERFMDYVGLSEVETKGKNLPILPGVHDLDDAVGITIH